MEQFKKTRIYRLFRQIGQFLKPMNISIHSAYTSFFIILSVFPVLVILFNLLTYTAFGLTEVMALVSEFLPEAFLPMVERIMNGAYQNSSGAVLSVSILTALWSAGRGIRGVLMGLNAVYGLEENRSYLHTRAISVFYTFLFLIVLVLTMVLHVFGNTILDYLRMTTNPLLMFLMDIIDWRNLLMLALQTGLFLAVYSALPNRRHSFRQNLPGALLTAVGWTGFSKLFSIYVEFFPHYNNIYGSVYAVALGMLWLYCCICIVFYGGALNRFLMERRWEEK